MTTRKYIFNPDHATMSDLELYDRICTVAKTKTIKSKTESRTYEMDHITEEGIQFKRLDAKHPEKNYIFTKKNALRILTFIRSKREVSLAQLKQFMQEELDTSTFILQSPTIALLDAADIIY